MEHNQQNGFSRFTKIAKDYWFIFIFLGTLIFSWAIFKNTLANNTERINKLEGGQNGILKDIGEIKTSVKGIETSVGFLIEEYKKKK